jgi:hypothetical protein
MPKRLAILVLLLAIVQTLDPAPGWASTSSGDGSDKNKDQGQSKQGTPAPSLPLVKKPIQPVAADQHGNQVGGENAEHSVKLTNIPPITLTNPVIIADKHKPWWDYIPDWGQLGFAGMLATVGCLQVWLLFRQEEILRGAREEIHTQARHMKTQVDLMERQTKVSEQTSQNATDSLNLFINAERAKITIDIADSGRSFRIRGKNTGKAVAQVKRASGYTIILPYGQQLPPVPPYLSEPDTLGDFVESIPPNEFIAPMDNGGDDLMMNLSDLDLCAAIRDKRSALWVFGRFVYFDGISQQRRELRFCYEADVDQKMETNISMSGPSAYRVET